MSSESQIAIPSLIAWTESHLKALLEATRPEAVKEAIHKFLANDARITVNGKHVSVDEYSQFAAEIKNKRSAEVKFDAAVSVPKDQKEPTKVRTATHFLILSCGSYNRMYHAPMYRQGLWVFSMKPRW
jgi:hypothetical protein